VWGAAYHIPASHVQEVRQYLDIREINGYSIQFTPFHPAVSTAEVTSPPPDTEPNESERGMLAGIRATNTINVREEAESIKCLVYIGLPENPQFLGAQDPDALARKILDSTFSCPISFSASTGFYPSASKGVLMLIWL
jgi:cation transport regulator ChaC